MKYLVPLQRAASGKNGRSYRTFDTVEVEAPDPIRAAHVALNMAQPQYPFMVSVTVDDIKPSPAPAPPEKQGEL